jgi:AraC-like DNA-binding protein
MECLTRWRMMVGGDLLVHSSDPVSAIALSLGYESKNAFSTAFKKVMGMSPRQYGRGWIRSNGSDDSGPPRPTRIRSNIGCLFSIGK